MPRTAHYQYPFRAAFEMSVTPSPVSRRAPCSTPVVTPLTAAQLAMQMAQEVEAQTAINGRFYKTRMCLFHQKGACVKGNTCSYAHCEAELRPAPDLVKTRLCQDWLNGNCTSMGCKFAHGRHELRFTHDFYKTKICHFWQQGGCTKGVFCRHAHGSHELRPSLDSASSTSNDSSPGGDSRLQLGGLATSLLLPLPTNSRSSTRSSNRSSPRHLTTSADHAHVAEALRLASEARRLVERGAEILLNSAEPEGYNLQLRTHHRSHPSYCSSFAGGDYKLSTCPNSPLPAYATTGSGITVTTTAPSLSAFPTGMSTPHPELASPALSFSLPDAQLSDAKSATLVDSLIESLLMHDSPLPEARKAPQTSAAHSSTYSTNHSTHDSTSHSMSHSMSHSVPSNSLSHSMSNSLSHNHLLSKQNTCLVAGRSAVDASMDPKADLATVISSLLAGWNSQPDPTLWS